MGGRKSKQKGDRREREIVERFNKLSDFHAQRVPLSGAANGYKGDIDLLYWDRDGIPEVFKAEVKARSSATGWQTIKKWLGENDLLILVEDRQEPLVVVPWAAFERLVSGGVQCSTNCLGPENHSPPLS